MPGLWDMYQGYGESLEDMGGGRNFDGFGSGAATGGFSDKLSALNQLGFPKAMKPGFSQFGQPAGQGRGGLPQLIQLLMRLKQRQNASAATPTSGRATTGPPTWGANGYDPQHGAGLMSSKLIPYQGR